MGGCKSVAKESLFCLEIISFLQNEDSHTIDDVRYTCYGYSRVMTFALEDDDDDDDSADKCTRSNSVDYMYD